MQAQKTKFISNRTHAGTTTPYQGQVPAEKKFSSEESNIIQCEINKLLQKEVIQSTSYKPGQLISTIFLSKYS